MQFSLVSPDSSPSSKRVRVLTRNPSIFVSTHSFWSTQQLPPKSESKPESSLAHCCVVSFHFGRRQFRNQSDLYENAIFSERKKRVEMFSFLKAKGHRSRSEKSSSIMRFCGRILFPCKIEDFTRNRYWPSFFVYFVPFFSLKMWKRASHRFR